MECLNGLCLAHFKVQLRTNQNEAAHEVVVETELVNLKVVTEQVTLGLKQDLYMVIKQKLKLGSAK